MSDLAAEARLVRLTRPAPHVALVTLNRPEVRNAINSAVSEQLAEVHDHIESDPDIWISIVTGAGGKAFSAGADLRQVAEAGDTRLVADLVQGFMRYVRSQEHKPRIAAVDGYALAGGCELMLACDMVVATRSSIFGLPEAKRGLIAAAGGVQRLCRRMPRNIVMELIATGRTFSAEEAARFGLVNRLVEEDPVAAALKLAEEICANAPVAVRAALNIARRPAEPNEDALWDYTVEWRLRVSETADYREGPRAFVEKRQPRWTGR